MAEQESPAQEELDDQKQNETIEQSDRDAVTGDEGEGSGQTSEEAGGPDEPSESSRRGIPGYQ